MRYLWLMVVVSTGLAQPPYSYLISTVAGNGRATFLGGQISATSVALFQPARLALDAAGNLYIADNGNHCLRKVDTNGVIARVVGTGVSGWNGDNQPGPQTQLDGPEDVAVDQLGNLFFSDTNNQRIRKLTGGVVTTVAGNGQAGYGGDNGPATSAALRWPDGVAVDRSGVVYFADTFNHRARS